jgi:ribosome-associated protein
VAALAEKLLEKLKKNGYRNVKVEGLDLSEWVLLDIGDLIVHIFQPEIRDFYNLEKLWSSNHASTVSRQA